MARVLLSQALGELYAAIDTALTEHLKKFQVTCKRGCAHCCYLLTGVTAAEAAPIAEKLFEKPDWKEIVARLADTARRSSFDGLTRLSFFKEKVPCAFLDLKKNECEIYELRPAACRSHFVVSDPAFCDPDHPIGTTSRIDVGAQITEHVFDLAKQVEDPPMAAPLAVMVLYCMEQMCRSEPEFHSVLEKAIEGVPDPFEWMERHAWQITNDEEQDRRPLKVLP